jgi:HSP20 family protein
MDERRVGPVTTTLGRIWDQLRLTGLRFEAAGAAGEFAVRAEIPGVDPARDIRIWRFGALLRVEVSRARTRDDQIRSEFHYGRSIGSVDVPPDIDERRLTARYHRGVLTIASTTDTTVGAMVPIGSALRSPLGASFSEAPFSEASFSKAPFSEGSFSEASFSKAVTP